MKGNPPVLLNERCKLPVPGNKCGNLSLSSLLTVTLERRRLQDFHTPVKVALRRGLSPTISWVRGISVFLGGPTLTRLIF